MDVASIAASLILKGLDLAHKRRKGNLSKKEAQELYCRIFSSLLFEVHQNLERCNTIVNMAKKGGMSAGILSFFVRDALFSDFCIMCPEPRTVSELSEIYSAFERIHHWQRITSNLKNGSTKYIVGYAFDLFTEKKLHLKYNVLLKILNDLSPKENKPPKFNFFKTN